MVLLLLVVGFTPSLWDGGTACSGNPDSYRKPINIGQGKVVVYFKPVINSNWRLVVPSPHTQTAVGENPEVTSTTTDLIVFFLR